jgi:opacity protein-like surface antigen
MTPAQGPWRRANWFAAAVVAAVALVAPPAAAQSDDFRHYVEIYLMGASMSGTVGIGQLEGEIDVPSSTIFENLEFAALADYRGESEKWAVLADVVVMNLGASGTSSTGRGSADVDVDEHIFELDGAYRISSAFEVLAGLRYTDLQTRADLTRPGSEQEVEVGEGWIDPIVGVQAFLPLSEAFQLQLRGDIGGFGIGCDFTWQATARLNWQVSQAFRLGVGYRWLDQDYESGAGSDAFTWDILTQGPLVAGGVVF